MEYYSALKRNEQSSHEKSWRKLNYILLSERSQSEKATTPYNFNFIYWKRHNCGDCKKDQWLPRVRGGGEGRH